MPITAAVDHDARSVRIVLEGRVALGELTEKLDDLVKQGTMPYAKLFDATGAVLAFSDNDVMALAARTRAYAELKPRGPVALVAVGEPTVGILRRFMNLSPGERPLAMFDRIADGAKWLSRQARRNL